MFWFLGLLGICFIVLKLTSVIAWSWWFVLMPIYGSPILFYVLLYIRLYIHQKEQEERYL